jgi:ribosomal-protein-serine acetyltransferase
VDEETELKLVTPEDAPKIFDLADQGREYLSEWMPWVDTTRAVADTEGFIRRAQDQMRRGEGFHACVEYRGLVAGAIGYVYLDPRNRRTELGYWLGESFQGRGIMTRACRRLVDFAFESMDLHRVEIRVDVDNRKSRAIPERLGFAQEARFREYLHHRGRFRDVIMYARLRRDWDQEPQGGARKPLDGGPAVPPSQR